ncbi:flagellar basal body P-ring formation chaperone FlgA [Aliiglaciecola sp. LCG003]|uniref:flagellar basal body P-ring formation chaperone FlgA n=1 Tax=Aliiglaciecola sp. LCG003 TaxID=3053655 RepID=UPI002574411E|nr:flagellar basal body P-ring formation chaperone FlgA [Aliiglaciecola sp. LCG003]WJG10546.1 flagellar basal body P-ring formation chaperone FlgA [Aliiglaciecola sp. LCG003]
MKKLLNPSRTPIFLSFYCLMAFFSSATVTASQNINLARTELIESVEKYVSDKLSYQTADELSELVVKASELDPRLVIPTCSVPLKLHASDEALEQTNITVRASCPNTDWYLYLIVKASRMQHVVVLTRAVGPGTIISSQHVGVVMMDKNLIRTSTFADTNAVVGARMKKRSRAGQPVVPGQLCFVCKGDNILITANAGGVNIKTTGIAQQDGNIGDTIAVKNVNSNKMVHAQVVDTHQVEVQI